MATGCWKISSRAVPRQHYDIRLPSRSLWCARNGNKRLGGAGLLEGAEDAVEAPVAGSAQRLDFPLVGSLDAVDQHALLLGVEPLPGRELGPPGLEARQQLLQEEGDAAVPRGEVIRE